MARRANREAKEGSIVQNSDACYSGSHERGESVEKHCILRGVVCVP